MEYRDAGVDVEAGRAFVDRIRSMVNSTMRPEVLGGLGGFSGFFRLPAGYTEPVLVAGTDGVGTKLRLAHQLNCHNTVGIDLVAMCVNDVLTSGAEPLFFLDYLATGKLNSAQLAEVVSGIATGCRAAGCALLGGETAEMPGFYSAGEYDLAGFCVGIVERNQLLDGSQVQVGDVAIGLASRGVHSNGFSLIRKILDDQAISLHDHPPLFTEPLGETLLTSTQIYVKPVLEVRRSGLPIHGMAHITGGGLPENLPRCLGAGQAMQIDPSQWRVPSVFEWIAAQGGITLKEMFNTFNMGIGFVVIVPPEAVKSIVSWFQSCDVAAYAIGKVVDGDGSLLGLPE